MMMTQHDASELTEQLKQALDRLWVQYLPEMEQRVAAIEVVCEDYCDKARANGRDAAHKLAGVLGTFGLSSGTELAREAEALLSQWNAQSTHRVSQIAVELKQVLVSRETYPA